jgi:DNA-binding protein YbaB
MQISAVCVVVVLFFSGRCLAFGMLSFRNQGCYRVHCFDTTKLHINGFSWFSGKGKGNEDEVEISSELENLGGVAGIMDSMEKLRASQRVGERTNSIMQDLSREMVEGSAAEGRVKAIFDGQQRLASLKIDDAYFQSLIERADAKNELIDAVESALRLGYSKSSEKIEEKMKSFYSDVLSSSSDA